jgi:hypothetical protein
MGAWGIAIFSDDTAGDVRDDFSAACRRRDSRRSR